MRIDVEKAINDSYDHQRMCIERRYQLKRHLYTVEGFAVIALLIAIFAFFNALDAKNKIEEHVKECHSKIVIEKGK